MFLSVVKNNSEALAFVRTRGILSGKSPSQNTTYEQSSCVYLFSTSLRRAERELHA